MEITRQERVCALALNSIFGYEPKIARTLLCNLGSAEAVFKLDAEQLREVFGPYSKYLGRITPEALETADRELDYISGNGYSFLLCTEDAFPQTLLECEDHPIGLYVRSTGYLPELFNNGPYISIVGTRDISMYGEEWCQRIVASLAQSPCHPTIVSGLAIGVDVTAHNKALAYGLPTIAVIPCGIDSIYPSRHRMIANRIADTPGSAIITDFPIGTGPMAATFLRRNRIIAGMSQATILIESRIRGGGMMTARLASDYGREVFCLPGRIEDIRSQGCNKLIQEKIAEPIVSLATLGESLGLGRFIRQKGDDLYSELDRKYAGNPLLEALKETARVIRKERGISIDELCARLHRPYSETACLTGMLESDGIIVTDLLQRCSIAIKI